MKRETKRTFTYSCLPSIKKRAAKGAKQEGRTLSEVIERYLSDYSEECEDAFGKKQDKKLK